MTGIGGRKWNEIKERRMVTSRTSVNYRWNYVETGCLGRSFLDRERCRRKAALPKPKITERRETETAEAGAVRNVT